MGYYPTLKILRIIDQGRGVLSVQGYGGYTIPKKQLDAYGPSPGNGHDCSTGFGHTIFLGELQTELV